MGTRLLNTSHNTVTAIQALKMVNDRQKLNFTTLGVAIASVGIGAAATFISAGTAPLVVATLNAVGLSIGGSSIAQLIADSLTGSSMRSAIDKMTGNNSYILITTRVYEWSAGSGNHYTWYTEHSYTVYN